MINGIISAVLSLIIPGLGQAYARDFKKGILLFIVFVIIYYGCSYLSSYVAYAVPVQFIWFIGLIPWLFRLYAAFDAFLMWNSII